MKLPNTKIFPNSLGIRKEGLDSVKSSIFLIILINSIYLNLIDLMNYILSYHKIKIDSNVIW